MMDEETKKNFIQYLFNLKDDDISKKQIDTAKTNDNTINTTDTTDTANNISKENIETFINNTDNILKEWINHTNTEKGLTLYMSSIENNQETETQRGWLQGDHGFYLNSSKHIQLNDYLKDKLKNMNFDKGCLKLDTENNYQNIQTCNQELEKIQIQDIKDITQRIKFNYQVFEETQNFIKKKTETIKQQELKLQELQEKLENEKNKFQSQLKDIENLNQKIVNYVSLIQKYMNADYQSILNINPENFMLTSDLQTIITQILTKNNNNDDNNKEIDSIEKDIIQLSKQFN